MKWIPAIESTIRQYSTIDWKQNLLQFVNWCFGYRLVNQWADTQVLSHKTTSPTWTLSLLLWPHWLHFTSVKGDYTAHLAAILTAYQDFCWHIQWSSRGWGHQVNLYNQLCSLNNSLDWHLLSICILQINHIVCIQEWCAVYVHHF